MMDTDDVMPAADMRILLSQLDREEKDGKAMIDAWGDERMAQTEAQLAATYDESAGRFAQVAARIHAFDAAKQAEWDKELAEINAEIQQMLAEEGLPPSFAPSYVKPQLPVWWVRRGETADKERRSELIRVAAARNKADKAHAIVKQRVAYTKIRRQIISGALTSREARRLLDTIPTAQDLLPPIKLEELEAAVPLLPQYSQY